MVNNHDRREQDFIRLAVVILIVVAVVVGLGLFSVYGPVTGNFGPLELGPEVPG